MTLHDTKRILVLIAYLKWLAVISKQVDAGGDFCGQWPPCLVNIDFRLEGPAVRTDVNQLGPDIISPARVSVVSCARIKS
jgi:hypothetical protein